MQGYYEVQWNNNGVWQFNNRFNTLERAREHVEGYINTIKKDLRIVYKQEQVIEEYRR